MRIHFLALAAATTVAAASPATAAVNIFTENFDGVAPTTYSYGGVMVGQFRITDGQIDVIGDRNGRFFGCPNGDGNNCVDMNGNYAGTLTAKVNLVAGNTYRVSFDLAGNGPRTVDYAIAAGLGSSPYYQFTRAPGTQFANFGFDYLATRTGEQELVIQSLNTESPQYWGMIVDNVRVDNLSAAAVPEPAAWAMMIVGLGAVGGSLRRRRASAAATLAA